MLSLVILATMMLELAIIAALLLSIVKPAWRVWPPRKPGAAATAIVWVISVGVFAGTFAAGLLEWNAWNWPAALRWSLGVPLILVGNLLLWRGVFQLGFSTTSGAKGELNRTGLYRWTRNPQYIGDISMLAGWVFLSASGAALFLALLAFTIHLLLPRAEEPWLRARLGRPYEDYLETVPRFIRF